MVALALLLFASGSLTDVDCGSERRPPADRGTTILTMNVFGPRYIRPAPERFADIARCLDVLAPGVIALQEMTDAATAAALPTNGHVLRGPEGSGLVTIASKTFTSVDVAAAGFFHEQGGFLACDSFVPLCQKKGFLLARLRSANGLSLWVLNVHLATEASTARTQWREACRAVPVAAVGSLVVVGDFNVQRLETLGGAGCGPLREATLEPRPREDEAPASGTETHGHQLTGMTTWGSPKLLDHVATSTALPLIWDRQLVLDAPVGGRSLSDHKAVLVTLPLDANVRSLAVDRPTENSERPQ